MSLPLEGLRVLDLTRFLAGPFCSMILGDLGADIIKVEPTPSGEFVRGVGPFKDGHSVYFLSVHRNQRSLALNFRDPRGLALLRELADQADILVENFKPGVMAEMDMTYETLRKSNPRLIFTSVTGFGRGGPYSDWPGVDQIAQGMSGLMSVTGQEPTGPTRVGIPIGDVVAGMWGALGTQAAVIQRMSTGRGQLVETSLLGGLIGLLNVQAQRALTLGDVSGVVGNDHPVVCPCGVFQAKDGAFNMAVVSPDMWVKLCELLSLQDMQHDERFKDNSARLANRDELRRRLNEKFAERDKMEWTFELIKLGLPAGPLFSMDQVFADPHVIQTGMVEEIEHPSIGPLKQLALPIRMEGLGPRSVRSPPPLLGQHTQEILTELGVPAGRIAELARDGVIQFASGAAPA